MKAFLFLVALLSATIANAQSGGGFQLISFTVDGGGGPQTGGEFSLAGTIGQPDAATSAGTEFSLHSGFWPEPSAPTQPYLQIAPAPNGRVIVMWPVEFQNWLLEGTATLNGATWNVIGAGQPDGAWMSLILPADGSTRFFRLAQP